MDRGQLRWRASRHALLELDIVFKRFLDQHFDALDDEACSRLAELLALEDHDLWEMVSGRRECAEPRWEGLVATLRECGRQLIAGQTQ
jgi:succinate dehydrogenase flavin-adding protein (antitoxin of CptAB toxin-antitoxin module)